MGIYVIGYARHGKDTVAKILREYCGYSFKSSSLFCCEKAVYPVLKERYGYASIEECYADRANHRKEWFDLIRAYNGEDLARISREIFKEYDLYVGIRNKEELNAAIQEGLADHILWVDASKRLPPESTESMTITPDMATCYIDNSTTYEALRASVREVINKLELPYHFS
jgi:dephospho-CoA kinase